MAALDFVVSGQLIRLALPQTQFVYLGPCICLQLPSDSTSRWTPLLLATVGARQPPFGTFTLKMTPMLGVPQKHGSAPDGLIRVLFPVLIKQSFFQLLLR
ncbi:hypothetical protein D7Z26_06395 [Cohnella endophytica]|uniref:Uncharacterized protein n=1 Tax=Cohnella endophytica TaxID=2419778 RepID=A0A494Y8Q2_9BACL|nr:hypothetical protein D7Z26_06395 [Cohnella endophytica]